MLIDKQNDNGSWFEIFHQYNKELGQLEIIAVGEHNGDQLKAGAIQISKEQLIEWTKE